MARRPTPDSPIVHLANEVRALTAGVPASRTKAILSALDAQLPHFAKVLDLPPAVAQLRVLERALAAHDVRTIVSAPLDAWHERLALWERVHAAHRALVRMLDGDGYELLALDEEARRLFATLGLVRRADDERRQLVPLAQRLAYDDFRTPTDAQRVLRHELADAGSPSELTDERTLVALGDDMAPPLHAVRDALRAVLATAVDDESRAITELGALVDRLAREDAAPIVFRHLSDWLDHGVGWTAHTDDVELLRFAVRRRDGSPRSAEHEQREHLYRLRNAARGRGDEADTLALTDRLLALEPSGTASHFEHRLFRLELLGSQAGSEIATLLEELESMPKLPGQTRLLYQGLSLLRRIARERGDTEAELRAARRAFLLPVPRFEDHDARAMRAERHVDLASLLTRLGHFDEARHHLARATEATPRVEIERHVALLEERAALEHAAGDTSAENAARRDLGRLVEGAEPRVRARTR